jgi:hypothetical protein
VFLQHPVEVDESFRPRIRGVRLGREVPLDSLGLDVTGILFHVHLSKGALKSHQSIIPRDDGAFPAVQLPPSLRHGAAPAARRPPHFKEIEP